MKSLLFRIAVLLVLLSAFFWVHDDTEVNAAYCWEGVYNGWNNCDNQYSTLLYNWHYAPNTCASQASAACGSDQTCYATTYNNCMNAAQNTYDYRGMTYGSCISGVNNTNCVEQLDFCDQARQRRDNCNLTYSSEGDWEAWYACWTNSGIHLCE